jgi:hypothetical protein
MRLRKFLTREIFLTTARAEAVRQAALGAAAASSSMDAGSAAPSSRPPSSRPPARRSTSSGPAPNKDGPYSSSLEEIREATSIGAGA